MKLRVLIVRIGAMGDVLHALPAVAALRARHPDWFIGWAIDPWWSELLQIAGDFNDLTQGTGPRDAKALVDKWYRVPTGMWRRKPWSRETRVDMFALRRLLWNEHFDVCVDMQGSMKSAALGRMASARRMVGMAKPRERVAAWLYGERIPLTAPHVVEQGCELLGGAFGEILQPARVTLPMDEEDERWASGVIEQQRFCLISPSAGWGAKVWPAERYGAVAAELRNAGIKTFVNAPADGHAAATAVVAASGGAAQLVPCTLGRLIALTRRAGVVIAGDTGPLHLAAALERPVVGIYGPTDPARNGPYEVEKTLERVVVLRDPSSTTSHKRVPGPEPGMLNITVEEVASAAMGLLQKT